jgi:hypothetical protein
MTNPETLERRADLVGTPPFAVVDGLKIALPMTNL